MKNAAYLEWHLRDTYGSRESAWDVQLRLVQRRQQPGELLQDYANSLTELGTGHPGLTSFLYVDAFARGLNNKISAQAVRTAKPLTLEQAVSFSIENCGKYGEGAEVNNWELAAQMREKNRGNEAHHASVATTAEPADQLDWTKLGLNIGASGDKPPRYDPEGRPLEEITTVRGLGKSGFFPLAALQAIEAATRATVGEQKATRVSVTAGKQKVAKAMEIKWEEKKEPPAALVSEHAVTPGVVNPWPESNQLTHVTEATASVYGPTPSAGYTAVPVIQRYQFAYQGYGRRGRGFGGRGTSGNNQGGRPGGRGARFGGYGWQGRNAGQTPGQNAAQWRPGTICLYCVKGDHWWRRCPMRFADLQAGRTQPAASSTPMTNQPEGGTTVSSQPTDQ
ncbi:hypothetical protein GN958_ATG13358 [Phytophthora infestans]|uniref:Retrotransposon gag domain-containing protein n=1 Tax=Phytophthora infestans TaxID=4787 RepID=A0A8S9UD96_PHYIN|nr:hypothetical protein GN958_ATG13358 [Phytophthora infestans]